MDWKYWETGPPLEIMGGQAPPVVPCQRTIPLLKDFLSMLIWAESKKNGSKNLRTLGVKSYIPPSLKLNLRHCNYRDITDWYSGESLPVYSAVSGKAVSISQTVSFTRHKYDSKPFIIAGWRVNIDLNGLWNSSLMLWMFFSRNIHHTV